MSHTGVELDDQVKQIEAVLDLAEKTKKEPEAVGLSAVCEDFSQKMRAVGLDYGLDHDDMVRTFVSSLATKGFVILSGLSGSGKTRLAIALGEWFGTHRLLVEAVRPDWTSPESLLGAENHESESMDARYAWKVPRTLQFVLTAARDPHNPYLLVLDEMNLAHVEQYFADVLSGMESDQPVVPNLFLEAGMWRLPVDGPRYIEWPSNLFVVGTINIDETTYTFSPKVLDRASTMEFRVMPGALRSTRKKIGHVERGDSFLIHSFLNISLRDDPQWSGEEKLADSMEMLHELLYEYGLEFGHRVFKDAMRFGTLMAQTGIDDYRDVLDIIIVQKIIPKFVNTPSGVSDHALQAIAEFALPSSVNVTDLDLLAPPPAKPGLPRTYERIQMLARQQNRK